MYGEYLQSARERAGLSRAEAAALMGITPDGVRKIEVNISSPSVPVLDKMAGAYGCLIGDLLPNSGAGQATDRFEPIMAALMGLDEEEIADAILMMASQARLLRNGIMRRAHATAPRPSERTSREYRTNLDASGEYNLTDLLAVDRSVPRSSTPETPGDSDLRDRRSGKADRK
jgi:transcriptional regulator with XRE-family HTH domain